FIQRRSSISKAFKLTNSTVSLSQSAIWILIINRLSTNLSVLYPFQMDFSGLHDSHLSSLVKSTLEKFQLICCYFLTSSVIDQTYINEIVKRSRLVVIRSSLVVINSFYDPD
uniref:Uncharacterized protein n=1 Tax=Clytia hemisphaerica TaxID=252671 RepID=A0A7M5VAL3_9CNID